MLEIGFWNNFSPSKLWGESMRIERTGIKSVKLALLDVGSKYLDGSSKLWWFIIIKLTKSNGEL